MEIKIYESGKDPVSEFNRIGAFEGEERYSVGTFRFRNTSFDGGFIKTMTAGAVATPVHLRRGGNVRKIFEFAHAMACEHDVAAAILHPFSFAYYNKFGYEKVADHLIVSAPIRYIDFVPRRCSLVPCTEENIGDLISVYEEFTRGRNLLFERKMPEQFGKYKDSLTYVYYNGKKAEGYIIFNTEKVLHTNHYEEGKMSVREMVYTTPAALSELFSFIRMYEGELEDVEFLNLAMTPEIDLSLRNYTHTKYTLLPDIAAKVINTKLLLGSLALPSTEGALSVKIPEGDVGVRGTYLLEWGGGQSHVKQLSDIADADATVSAKALARLAYGYDVISRTSLPYLSDVEVNKNEYGFIAAFPKKACGVFEHF